MKEKTSRHDSDAEIIKRLNDRFKAEGMFYGRSIFDKGESAKEPQDNHEEEGPSDQESDEMRESSIGDDDSFFDRVDEGLEADNKIGQEIQKLSREERKSLFKEVFAHMKANKKKEDNEAG